MKGKRKKVLAGAIVVLTIGFGFVQEYIKVGTNHYLEVASRIPDFFDLGEIQRSDKMKDLAIPMAYDRLNFEGLSIFHGWSERAIKTSKWLFTVFFLAVHLVSICLIVLLIYGSSRFIKPIIGCYIAVIFLAGIVALFARQVDQGLAGYEFARKLLGALQSLVPLMVLIPAIEISKKMNR